MTSPRSSLVTVILFDFISGANKLTAFFLARPRDFPLSSDGSEFIALPKSDRRPAESEIPPVVLEATSRDAAICARDVVSTSDGL